MRSFQKEYHMRTENKSKREGGRRRRTYKTKKDFLLWLNEKDARQKQVTQAEITQPITPSRNH
jgi:hypothetical protein